MAADAQHQLTGATSAAPLLVPLADAAGLRDTPQPLVSHGCWYPSADPTGERVAFICDRTGVPQLWTGPVDGGDIHLLDSDPDPVTEVAWSPDGRWIAYTVAPGGGEHTRVLCVRPDGTGRRIVAGADWTSSAYLGCWARDGSAVAVTVAEPPPPVAEPAVPGDLPAGWAERDGHATLLGGEHYGEVGAAPRGGGGARDRLSAYLVDPDGVGSPALVAAESGAATLRVCDISPDGRLALVRRGPRGRREAVVVRMADLGTGSVLRVADGDPWIGRFSPDGRTLWLRSDHEREFAALLAAELDAEGRRSGLSVVAERAGSDLELLAFPEDGRTAALAWNVRGASALQTLSLPTGTPGGPGGAGAPGGSDGSGDLRGPGVSGGPGSPGAPGGSGGAGDLGRPDGSGDLGDSGGPGSSGGPGGPAVTRDVGLPHEVVTRIARGGPGGMVVALSGSQRKPGVWSVPGTAPPARTPWSSRDEDAVPPGRPPVCPVPLRPVARDGLELGGWYYRAPGRGGGDPAPCVIHLHGGPEEQERPVFDPLYHELLGRGLDVFAPDVRGSSGRGRSFVDADLGTGRFAAIDDVADCAAHAVLTGRADPTRLAVMGHSYGGYLTLASLVWHPALFRTGVAVCGMSDFATFFAGTEPWIAESAAHKYGHPERDRELLHALSPMSRIDELRVPLLAVHGEHDTNVPPGESEQIVRAARERGHPAELLMLREEGHEFRRADNRRLFRRTAADWLERYLTG
ncbi:prolyl oligopeptidase family serine peptidase [Streptomyces ficellus]|uniref:Prolyl oligopeptidase family serine peptidase n=1 Tax=Streptomyces ficellus TaxID=1977088 RepID=A0ABT7Z972_9ACTN|nr:prolyl oligopeptidase family serine peptidase [Streptomyces ficellus]MDN3296058.1 prolyl oligopeptidase family serine peptidase [Streptomyces ficellus]